jgi:hypothetical protein
MKLRNNISNYSELSRFFRKDEFTVQPAAHNLCFLCLTNNTSLLWPAGILAGEEHRYGLHGVILKSVSDNWNR